MYLYKKNRYYFYKRRIPNTDYFYSFNTKHTNCKKASKLVIIFNKLTRDIFEYIKRQGKPLPFNITEIIDILNDYKEQALIENKELEEARHNHIAELFKVEKEDPILGKIKLGGGQPEVIDKALPTFEYLGVASYSDTKTALRKHGKNIIKRSTLELKELYSKLRNSTNETDLLIFLSMLFKTEAQILKVDKKRAISRFGKDFINNNSQNNVQDETVANYIEAQKLIYESIDEVERNFLYNYCNYTEEILNDSKTNGAKVKKITEILTELIKDRKKEHTAQSITIDTLREVIKIIPQIPKKPINFNTSYSFYFAYKNSSNTSKDELRAIKTIRTELSSMKRYIEYLAKKKYISSDEKLELLDYLDVIKRDLNTKVKNNQLRGEENVEPFKDEMLKKIFNKMYKPYKTLFQKLKSSNVKDKDILIAKFYVPLIMFFVGSRVSELVHLKSSDCEFEEIDGNEKLLLYIEANEQKGLKTMSSKRIILVHDFLANELNLKDFVKKAKRENREYLFNTVPKDEEKISKSFNRDKDFLEGTLTKRDEFNNSRYTLYSFRHTYKTHMLSLNINETVINKIQGHSDENVADGYFSLTNELNTSINAFQKHNIIEWNDFTELTGNFIN
ncbi:tyrosine-type recombinase/integrase [Aliarcobacter butzleri]|uniref:tyrosine-type recombinase/integrase n=1 Tax=Aliarcobacter butzleri TaxID=28197 RepID=UPI00263E4F97|nr:tyrosine-type recombinase/integrase [Aliarcobacter butzleri]MDN5112699.1 tyrosine-type recombinase/integrase [Aliarcobacter butzleri]